MMKPIIFNTDMVEAILSGRKSQTRRLIKTENASAWRAVNHCHESDFGSEVPCFIARKRATEARGILYPPYDIGDTLYVRETYQHVFYDDGTPCNRYVYRASEEAVEFEMREIHWKWKPSIHMPKKAARIFLRVTDVRAERLQEITLSDMEKEGLYTESPYTPGHYAYAPGMGLHWRRLWNSTVKDTSSHGWDANPWVWVISFEQCERKIEL